MTQGKAPIHLWVVGVLSLLWNAMGALDYFMTQTQNEQYMAAFTPEQLEYFSSFPAWAVAFWAIAVWGDLLGSVLLLARNRWAYPVFAVGFGAMVITSVYNFLLSDGLEVMGGAGPLLFSAVIFIVSAALVWYSKKMVDAGVLR